jgi:hypothetical protein
VAAEADRGQAVLGQEPVPGPLPLAPSI